MNMSDEKTQAAIELGQVIYTNTIKDLQQKLLASQASEARLREALNELTTDLSDRAHKHEQEDALAVVACGNSAWRTALKALSTPPNTAELDKYVEGEIDKLLGEPVGEVGYLNDELVGYLRSDIEIPPDTKLYAKKG